jgi:hypothetical protein
MGQKEELVKIRVEIDDPELGVSGEGLWAKPLGDDLYEVRNSPWHTTEINYMDVVKAVAPDEDSKPNVISVYKRGGHRTIHILFLEVIAKEEKDGILAELNAMGATYEGVDGSLYAVDLKPEIDFDQVADYLETFEEKDWLGVRYATQPQPAGIGESVN